MGRTYHTDVHGWVPEYRARTNAELAAYLRALAVDLCPDNGRLEWNGEASGDAHREAWAKRTAIFIVLGERRREALRPVASATPYAQSRACPSPSVARAGGSTDAA
jgi:hypothetical protein